MKTRKPACFQINNNKHRPHRAFQGLRLVLLGRLQVNMWSSGADAGSDFWPVQGFIATSLGSQPLYTIHSLQFAAICLITILYKSMHEILNHTSRPVTIKYWPMKTDNLHEGWYHHVTDPQRTVLSIFNRNELLCVFL